MIPGKKLALRELLYLTALALYVGVDLFCSTYLYNILASQGDPIIVLCKFARYIAYALCACKIAMRISSNKIKILAFFTLFLGVILVSIKGTDKAAFFYILIIIAAKDVDFRKILRVFMSLQIGTLAFCFLCCYVFGIGNASVSDEGSFRYFLGFGWVNRASYVWLGIILEYICLKDGKIGPCELLLFLAGTVFFYAKTSTMFSFVISICAICFFGIRRIWLLRKGRRSFRFSTVISKIDELAFPLFALIGILSNLLYNSNNPIMYALNRFVNYRFSLGQAAIQKYGLGLFGNDTVWTGASTLLWELSGNNTYEYVDCGYLQIALDYGLLMLALVVALYCLAIHNANKRSETSVKYTLLIFGVLSIFEPRLIDFTINPFILYGLSTLKINKHLRESLQTQGRAGGKRIYSG